MSHKGTHNDTTAQSQRREKGRPRPGDDFRMDPMLNDMTAQPQGQGTRPSQRTVCKHFPLFAGFFRYHARVSNREQCCWCCYPSFVNFLHTQSGTQSQTLGTAQPQAHISSHLSACAASGQWKMFTKWTRHISAILQSINLTQKKAVCFNMNCTGHWSIIINTLKRQCMHTVHMSTACSCIEMMHAMAMIDGCVDHKFTWSINRLQKQPFYP